MVQTAVLIFVLDRNGYLRDEGGQHDVQWKQQDSKEHPASDSGTWGSETWLMGGHRSGVPWKSGWEGRGAGCCRIVFDQVYLSGGLSCFTVKNAEVNEEL